MKLYQLCVSRINYVVQVSCLIRQSMIVAEQFKYQIQAFYAAKSPRLFEISGQVHYELFVEY